jgi:hypothetical protein
MAGGLDRNTLFRVEAEQDGVYPRLESTQLPPKDEMGDLGDWIITLNIHWIY